MVPVAMGLPSGAAAQSSTGAAMPETVSVSLTVNGLCPRTTLLDLLREHLDLTGTKKGCDQGQCGASTVLLDGGRINSCLTFAVMHDGAQITTIECLRRCSRRQRRAAGPSKHSPPRQCATSANITFRSSITTR
jgi:xanthine dehydrogenase YagT iron-sulfur-binding subunit